MITKKEFWKIIITYSDIVIPENKNDNDLRLISNEDIYKILDSNKYLTDKC